MRAKGEEKRGLTERKLFFYINIDPKKWGPKSDVVSSAIRTASRHSHLVWRLRRFDNHDGQKTETAPNACSKKCARANLWPLSPLPKKGSRYRWTPLWRCTAPASAHRAAESIIVKSQFYNKKWIGILNINNWKVRNVWYNWNICCRQRVACESVTGWCIDYSSTQRPRCRWDCN